MKRDTQDKLEKHVEEHRSEFDTLSPKESVWEGIHAELDSSKRTNVKMVLWRAAAIILFVFSIGLTFYVNQDNILKRSQAVVYDTEFLDTEKYYTSVISDRQDLIRTVAQSYPEIETDFKLDWKQLDDNYQRLKVEYEANQSDDIRNALVQNLRSRVSLLNKQIEVLEEIDSDNKNILEI